MEVKPDDLPHADPGVTAACFLASSMAMALAETGQIDAALRMLDIFEDLADSVFKDANLRQLDTTIRLCRKLLLEPESGTAEHP